jgi:hypothetical protein
VALLAVAVVALGAATAAAGAAAFDENLDATETYERAYAPFDDGPPEHSAILLPDPYGDWLNHPFQTLRNEPGFGGRAVYAIDDRPFAVADAYPDRDLYRYGYRGAWAPAQGSPEAARLQRVRDVAGDRVRLDAALGVPEGATGVTVQVEAGGERSYHVARNPFGEVAVALVVAPDRATVDGDLEPVDGEGGVAIDDDTDEVVLGVFVDRGDGGGFSYRLELPVDVEGGRVRALSPRIERCRSPRRCDGAAAHVPSESPDGVTVETTLRSAYPADGEGSP